VNDAVAHPPTRALRHERSAIAFLASTFLMTVATVAQVTALGKQVFDTTARELDLGLIGLAEFVPAVLLVVVTGTVADRFDRRRVALVALSVEAVALLALAAASRGDLPPLRVVLAVVVLFGIGRAFAAPALRAMPATIVAPELLPRVMALFAAMWQAGIIVGPVLGGVLYARSPATAYVVAAVLVLGAAAVLATVRFRPAAGSAHAGGAPAEDGSPGRPGTFHEAFEGLRAIRRRPVLLGAISLDLFAVLFGGAVALLPAIATDRLGTDATGLGWLRAAGGIGAAVITLTLAVRPLQRRVGRWLMASVAAFGVATIGLGLTERYAVAFACLLALSAADAVSVFIRTTLLPLVTPDAIRGRVLAVEAVFIGASNELGAFESGVAGELLGAPGAIVFGGIATLVVVALWWVLFPALRDVDRFPTAH